MNFERGKEPVKALDIGRHKNARPLIKVIYQRDGHNIVLTDPDLIGNFIERFSKLEIPNDPLFGIQRVILISTEKYLDHSTSALAAITAPAGTPRRDPIERVRDVEIYLHDYSGKDFIYNDKIYPIPTLDEMEKAGFGHFAKKEANVQADIEDKLKKAKSLHQSMSDSLKSYAAMDYSGSMDIFDAESKSKVEILKARLGMDDEDIKMNEEAQKAERRGLFRFLPAFIPRPGFKKYWIDIETMP